MTSINYTINIKSKRKIYGIIGALITLMIPFFLMFFNQANHLETDQSLCPLKMLTGFPCPGCGITKSLVYFYEGDLQKSLYYHILGPFVILFCIVTIGVLTTELITKKEYFNSLLFNKKLAYGLGIFLATYHFIRIIYFINNNSMDDILHQSIWR
jgi:Na+/H+ antiporter NhaC